MTTPEQPAQPLTRKQMREIRNTGATPVITMDAVPDGPAAAPEPAQPEQSAPEPEQAAREPEPSAPEPVAPPTPAPTPVAPLARAAEPVLVPAAPVADSAVDLGVSPLTRRQARQQERIRTASVPVITPEVAAAHTAASAPAPAAPTLESFFAAATVGVEPGPTEPEVEELQVAADHHVQDVVVQHDEAEDLQLEDILAQHVAQGVDDDDSAAADAASDRAVLNPYFGAGLLAGEPAQVDLPPSFDQLLAHSSTGSVSAPNALIVSQTSTGGIVAPVTASGEVLITGTLNLPEGLGSIGHAPGAADGKEADAVLVDGELPAHSSPTPIAASAAISTVKQSGEIITPPTPEKSSKLMMTLAITAGVLALALVGVLILAFANGVF